jgi:hypothetical protein
MSKRPHHIASASWAAISLELSVTVFNGPKRKQSPDQYDRLITSAVERIEVTEDRTTRTTVSGKWVFVTAAKGCSRASR